MHKIIALATLFITLTAVNWSIAGKESHLASGKTVYLELAPVDPRSLMQGDYMALRFAVAREVQSYLYQANNQQAQQQRPDNNDGYVVVSLDERNIASYQRIYNAEELAANEVKMRYRVRDHKVKFATNAFFFQEGKANTYQASLYGQFKVDDKGELLLTSMYDKNLIKLGSVD